MGTRSTTHIFNVEGKHLVSMYKQFDGYPTGHGQELADFLKARTIVNGFGSETAATHANGMGCLAAQIVAHFKDGIGGYYITPEDDRQEYNYFVTIKDGKIHLKCESEYSGLLYSGLASGFNGKRVEK